MINHTYASSLCSESASARPAIAYLLLFALLVLFPASGRLQALTISEVMYHSGALEDQGDEFIELYNENIDPIDLSGYSICNGINFVFPRGTYLDGHSYLVVCANEAAIRDRYGITNTLATGSAHLTIPARESRSVIPAAALLRRCVTTIGESGRSELMVRGIPLRSRRPFWM